MKVNFLKIFLEQFWLSKLFVFFLFLSINLFKKILNNFFYYFFRLISKIKKEEKIKFKNFKKINFFLFFILRANIFLINFFEVLTNNKTRLNNNKFIFKILNFLDAYLEITFDYDHDIVFDREYMRLATFKAELYRFGGNKYKSFYCFNNGILNKIYNYGFKNCNNLSLVNEDLQSFGELNHQLDVFVKITQLNWLYRFSHNKNLKKNNNKKLMKILYLFNKAPNKFCIKLWKKYFDFISFNFKNKKKLTLDKTFFIVGRWLPMEYKNKFLIEDINFSTPYIQKKWKSKTKKNSLFKFNKNFYKKNLNYIKNRYNFNIKKKEFIFLNINGPKKLTSVYHLPRYVDKFNNYEKTINFLSNKYNILSLRKKNDNKTFPENKNIIYLDDLNDETSLFLIIGAKFLITTSSGPNYVGYVFNTPTVWTNMMPYFSPVNAHDRVVYKKIIKNNLFLSKKEIVKNYLCQYSFWHFYFNDIEYKGNNSDEIFNIFKNYMNNKKQKLIKSKNNFKFSLYH